MRAGAERFYNEGIGFQVVPGIGLSARTEIFEEPNPVDDYILEAKILNLSTERQFQDSIVPLFTRSWAGRIVADYEPFPRVTYEFDKRNIFHEFQTRFGVKNRNLETHLISVLHSFPEAPVLGVITVSPVYKRIFQESNDDLGAFQDRDEVELNITSAPTDDLEYFFQTVWGASENTKTPGSSHSRVFKGQVRMRFPEQRLFIIPSYEYSETTNTTEDDEFIRRDMFVDWGMDVTDRLRVPSKQQFVVSELTQSGREPSNPLAKVFNAENTLSYELFKDFDVSGGFDYSKAVGLNAYNNIGLRIEMKLFKPGIIRTSVGYRKVFYYNIDEGLSLWFWRFFLFM